MKIAPMVPYTEGRIKGRIPNLGADHEHEAHVHHTEYKKDPVGDLFGINQLFFTLKHTCGSKEAGHMACFYL